MEDLKLKSLAALPDLMADETTRYFKLVHYGGGNPNSYNTPVN
jgi:hypothetical protein